MNTLKAVSRGAIVFLPLALIALFPAVAQPKPGMSKTVFENDKILVDTMS
jgi:hypothetical protein